MPATFIFCVNYNASQADRFNVKEMAGAVLKGEFYVIEADSLEAQNTELDKRLAEIPDKENVIVVACGGDGTVLGVIQYLLKNPGPKLGILPVGTGNLLAKSLEIPESPNVYFDRLAHGTIEKKVSLGHINENVFSLAASSGIDVSIMERTPVEHKKTLGIYAYLVEGLSTLFEDDIFEFDIIIDGNKISTRAKSIMVIHHRQFLKGLFPFLDFSAIPDSKIKNDCLDVIILNPHNAIDYLSLFYSVITSEFLHDNPDDAPIRHFQGKEIEVITHESMPVQVDGDVIEKTPARLKFMEDSIPVVIPKPPELKLEDILPVTDILKSLEEFKRSADDVLSVLK